MSKLKEFEAKVLGVDESMDEAASLFESDLSASISTDLPPEVEEELTSQDWAEQTVQMLDQAKVLITKRFRQIESRSVELHELTKADHAKAEVKMLELMEVEAKFYAHIDIELPNLIQRNTEAAARGVMNAQLEVITDSIKTIIRQHIADELNPSLKAINDTTVNLRLAAADVEERLGGWKQYLRMAGIAVVVAVVIFTGLKIQMGLGVDAQYGRKAKAAIQMLDPKNQATIESIIKTK